MSLPALTPHRQCSRCAPCPGIGNCGCGCHYFGTVNHAREAIDDGAVVPISRPDVFNVVFRASPEKVRGLPLLQRLRGTALHRRVGRARQAA